MNKLLGINELKRLYDEMNSNYFYGKLQRDIKIEWSSRLTSAAGVCYINKQDKSRNIIRLSTWYHEKYPEEIEETLLHEMIHLVVHGHGKAFMNEMNRIKELGGKVNRNSREKANETFRWIYTCPSCKIEFRRQRRLPVKKNYICRKCRCMLTEKRIGD